MAGLHLLLQAGPGAAERHSVLRVPGPLRPAARPLRGERLGLVFLPGRRGVRDLSPAIHTDPEQPHGRGLQRLLRALPVPADLGRRRALAAGGLRGAGFFAAFAAANELPALAFLALALRPAAAPRSHADSPVLRRRRRRSRSPASWRLSTPCSASSSWPTRRSGPTSTSTREASGRRRWSWMRSTSTPSRTPIYLFHMTFGHHGVFSLTPIFLFSLVGAARLLWGGGRSGVAAARGGARWRPSPG